MDKKLIVSFNVNVIVQVKCYVKFYNVSVLKLIELYLRGFVKDNEDLYEIMLFVKSLLGVVYLLVDVVLKSDYVKYFIKKYW